MMNTRYLPGIFLWAIATITIHNTLFSQSLSFIAPTVLLQDNSTDKAPDIINFKNNFFVTWKQPGAMGSIMYSYLGNKGSITTAHQSIAIPNEQSAFGPALRTIGNRNYLLWIAANGSLRYVINDTDSSFDIAHVQELSFTTPVQLSLGVTAGTLGDKAILAAHSNSKTEMVFCLLNPGTDGVFEKASPQVMPEKSADYAFVTGINNTLARFCWKSNKDDIIKYADYNTNSKTWLTTTTIANSKTKTAPAIYHIWGGERLFYSWRGAKKDNRLYYATALENEQPAKGTALPDYFKSEVSPSFCIIDDNNFFLAFTGTDNKLYLSKFSNYNPAKWMQQILQTTTSNKTLQDIVIPGAHDAGMSVLTAPGGQQPGTINECNTLTQKLNIEQQLNAGIRMFDLRAGTYQNRLYSKHCASDCMAEAIGGGYGEKLYDIATAIRKFLQKNRHEIILLSFSHFCEKETPLAGLKDSLLTWIGKENVYANNSIDIGKLPLKALAGKVIISFEMENSADKYFPTCSIADKSSAFVNFKRKYAATNDINILMDKEKQFFVSLKEGVQNNDIIRLDWQLTQNASEAPTICNDFEDEKLSPIINGAILLANAIKKNKSIIDHSLEGNKHLPLTIDAWIKDGTITKKNKPHILYVDVAGEWITDYCIDLNESLLYK